MQEDTQAPGEAPVADVDSVVILRGATWADYQRMLEIRGEGSVPRLAYLEGVLELMSPSRSHERIKSLTGRLVEVWCELHAIEFTPYGSWTLESKAAERGVEPDECYVFGEAPEPERPDLAIEVIWSSTGLNKREIFRKLGVRELWTWRRGGFTVHALRGDTYEELSRSEVLPGIDLDEVASFLDRPSASQAMREYRSALMARRQ